MAYIKFLQYRRKWFKDLIILLKADTDHNKKKKGKSLNTSSVQDNGGSS